MPVDGFVKYGEHLFVLLVVSSPRCNFVIISDTHSVSVDV